MSDDINRYIVHGVDGEGQPAFLYIWVDESSSRGR